VLVKFPAVRIPMLDVGNTSKVKGQVSQNTGGGPGSISIIEY